MTVTGKVVAALALMSSAFALPCEPVTMSGGTKVYNTSLHVCSDSIIRVCRTPAGRKPKSESLAVIADWEKINFSVTRNSTTVVVTTRALRVQYDVLSDSVSFFDNFSSDLILQEKDSGIKPSTDNLFEIAQSWSTSTTEGIYGGGSYQNGLVNWAGSSLSMVQFNSQSIVPFFTSTKGYGILWDDYSWTHLNEGEEIKMTQDTKTGAFKGSVGYLSPGKYNFLAQLCYPFGCAANHNFSAKLVNDDTGSEILSPDWDDYRVFPDAMSTRYIVEVPGHYSIISSFDGNKTVKMFVNPPSSREALRLRSEVSEGIDYYFTWGNSTMDGAIAGYRRATGTAPMYGAYAYGLWQCKNRYKNQSDLLTAASSFREKKIPVDNIVQDWMYWGSLGWGPHWSPDTYPDPKGMVEGLNELDFHFMVSVWSKFGNTTTFYKQMKESGYLLNNTDSGFYDPYSMGARELFFNFSSDNHFAIGVDALWLDATEPEGLPNINNTYSMGSGNQYLNPYSLMTTEAVSTGLRKVYPNQQGRRVFQLTRSSFLGQQRTGASLWSGDISGTWEILRRQIASSINYQLSGIPYWSQDIGGFFRPADQYESNDYWCLLTRWFQFGVFTPIFRTHGTANTELWNYGPYVQNWVVTSAINLRYRLLPYIYSGFRKVEQDHYTMQRHMAMDFPEDANVLDISDQFFFGDSFLVAPVYTPNATQEYASRSVYFPAGVWFNFYSASAVRSTTGITLDQHVRITEIPVYVKEGTVLVMGPEIQHTGEKADPLEVRLYDGDFGSFVLFEDDGESRSTDAAHQFSEITFTHRNGVLKISNRVGSFPGMLLNRTLNIVKVSPGHGTGPGVTRNPDHVVKYSGEEITVQL